MRIPACDVAAAGAQPSQIPNPKSQIRQVDWQTPPKSGRSLPNPADPSQIRQVDWQMWIVNHLWAVDQCVCANPSGNHCTNPPCYSYVWHYDTFKTAQYLGREEIGVEWLNNAGVGE